MIKHKAKRKIPFLIKLVKNLAPKIGAKFVLEPDWNIVGQIIYPSGVVRSIRFSSMDLNSLASADIATDKGYAKFFMKKHGFPVAKGETVYSDKWAEMIKSKKNISYATLYASTLGYPLVLKPNSKSQGTGVSVVNSAKELISSLKEIFKIDKIAIIEEYMPGRDYRVVVLDGEIISAYERVALSVVGDGQKSVLSLLKEKQKMFIKKGRDTKINFNDRRIILKLKKIGYSFKTILKKSEKVFLLDNANLSTGGDSIDMTSMMHKGFKKISIDLARDMGLRMAGVDIMVTKGDITEDPKNCKYYIIEINAAPGLDHYVTTGAIQRKTVEDMYMKVLKAMGKKD